MREHKFKYYLKRKSDGEIIETVILTIGDMEMPYNLKGMLSVKSKSSLYSIKYDLEILGPYEYIGYKDKNDKEAYEGDILSHHGPNGLVYSAVIFDRCQFCLDLSRYGEGLTGLIIQGVHDMEIVGNIHQNKELLKS